MGTCRGPADLNWDDLRVFGVLADVGSLGKAAKALSVDHSTVSRRLAALEGAMGTQLAVRTPSGLELTGAGEALATAASGIRDAIEQVERRLGGEDDRPEGLVRVSTTPGLSSFLLRGLSGLRSEYPQIQVELLPRPAALDLLRREADIAIRFFREKTASLITRKIGEMGWSLYASEDYVAARSVEIGAASLEGHDVIGYVEERANLPGPRWLNEHLGGTTPVLTCFDPTSAAAAVAAGIGVSTLPCLLAQVYPKLCRLTPDVLATTEVFLVLPPDHKNTKRVRLTADAIVDYFAASADTLAGKST